MEDFVKSESKKDSRVTPSKILEKKLAKWGDIPLNELSINTTIHSLKGKEDIFMIRQYRSERSSKIGEALIIPLSKGRCINKCFNRNEE